MPTISIACAHDKAGLMTYVQSEIARAGHRNPQGELFELDPRFYTDEHLIGLVLGRDFPLIWPHSWFSLAALDRQWTGTRGDDAGDPVDRVVNFAASPVVFLMSNELFDDLESRTGPVGWSTLFGLGDWPLSIMHAQGSTTDGMAVATSLLLAARARSDASPGPDDRLAPQESVRSVEARVIEYGSDDQVVLTRAFAEGARRADIVIVQERAVLQAMTGGFVPDGTLVYPSDGTVWVEEVVASVSAWQGPDRSEGLEMIARALKTPIVSTALTTAGLHSIDADLGTPAETATFAAAQPGLTAGRIRLRSVGAPPMVLPGYRGVRILGQGWSGMERPVDVFLVLDTSESMDSEKLHAACRGASAFLAKLHSPASSIGLIAFSDEASIVVQRLSLAEANRAIPVALDALVAGGYTALLDAVHLATADLLSHADPAHLRAIVALTDGQENASKVKLADVRTMLDGSPILFFSIAYGADADHVTLAELTAVTGGDVISSGTGEIERIFESFSARV